MQTRYRPISHNINTMVHYTDPNNVMEDKGQQNSKYLTKKTLKFHNNYGKTYPTISKNEGGKITKVNEEHILTHMSCISI